MLKLRNSQSAHFSSNFNLMKFCNHINSLLLILTVVYGIQAIDSHQIGNTFVTEIIVPFDMPMDDLKTAALNQLSRNDFKTNQFSGDQVRVSKLVYKTTYNGSGRIVTPSTQSPKHSVTGDSVDVLVTYQAIVNPKLLTNKTYNGSTTLKIYLNYTKQISAESGQTVIEGVSMMVDGKSFNMAYSGNPSSEHKKILDNANNGVQSKNITILHLLQTEEYSSQLVEEYFLDNLVGQKLSPTYDSTYQYQFNGFNISFDMSTAKVQTIDKGIKHSMKGSIKNYNSQNQLSSLIGIGADGDFHTLFTVNFMKNLVMCSMDQNQNWKNFKLDRTSFKMSAFGWRLIDLEYIIEGFAEKYPQYYLNDIRVVCNPQTLNKLGIDEVSDKMHSEITWGCKGNLLGVAPSPLILDFDVKLTYLINFEIANSMIYVLLEKTYVDSLTFREVDGLRVIDSKIAKFHAKEIVSNMRGYTLGSNFKVKQGSSKIALKQNQGLWVR